MRGLRALPAALPHVPPTGLETASPRGRIAAMRAVEEGHATVDASFTRMMDECLACRACEAACPSGVPFGRMIEGARAQAEPTGPRARAASTAPAWPGCCRAARLVLAAGWMLGRRAGPAARPAWPRRPSARQPRRCRCAS